MKLIYRPIGLILGVLAGVVARRLFAAVWSKVDDEKPPKAKTERASWSRVIAAAALQGVTFSVVRALFDRAGARGFAHLFGIWPGEKRPDPA